MLGSFNALLNAIEVMQSHFFAIWQGTWPDAIDWTAAVMGTQVSATLSTMTRVYEHKLSATILDDHALANDAHRSENLINRYFTHVSSFYFGENAFSLRTQAYDDMLWVVLGWLESINFINLHSDLHYASNTEDVNMYNASTWYAQQFIPSFAHRARLFYDLASKGWDTSLCGGGMIWSPYLAPYKNAITNQLYIAASVSMYLYFPGDENPSPFEVNEPKQEEGGLPPAKRHDPKYLKAAVEGYEWLKSSNMTNGKGLYTDGFHIRGWRGDGSKGTKKCDLRDEQVYTYNQGVLLSGLRGLWEATGSRSYLEDGHQLIRNVIAATGWLEENLIERPKWAGLGRNGVLEEACDASATCSQNGQTFKGIFFHHLTIFCAPLPNEERHFGSINILDLHSQSCREYGPWIKHNAQAAYRTVDHNGEFGMWWGYDGSLHKDRDFEEDIPDVGTDYRNKGVPRDEVWRLPTDSATQVGETEGNVFVENSQRTRDPNDRGRGRTVETQSGGVAVLRALRNLVD